MDTKKKLNQSVDQKQPEAWTEFAPTSSLQDDESYDLPEIRTELPLPARPMVKGGFAIALSGSALVLVAIFFQLASGISWNDSKQTTQEQNVPFAQAPSSLMTAEEKLQWCLASGKCSKQEDSVKKTKTINSTAPQPNQTKEKRTDSSTGRTPDRPDMSNEPATNVAHPVTVSRPVRVVRYVTPPHQPPTLAVATRPITSIQPPTRSFRYPVAPTPTKPRMQPLPLQPTASDPVALLAQASNLGIYTTVRRSSHSPSYSSSQYSRTAQLVVEQPLGNDVVGSEFSARPMKNWRLGQVVPVTTRIKATVATGISWVGSKTKQKFRVQTTENVKDENNNIALPKGTYLLAQVNQSNPSGYAEVQILSARINGQDKPISADAIIVQGTNGEPIQAKVKNQRGGLGKTVIAAGLAGISGAASTLNATKIIVGDTTTVSSGSNVEAAIVEGVTNSLSQEISGRVGQSTRYQTGDELVFVLKEGTKLQLFVNEPLSL